MLRNIVCKQSVKFTQKILGKSKLFAYIQANLENLVQNNLINMYIVINYFEIIANN